MNTLSFSIQGLTCSACAKLCTMKLAKIPGVSNVVVDPVTGDTAITAERPIEIKEAQAALSGTDYSIK
ncbi:heavy-metal-associated domain-containing protein [Candidatus Falkowbacteria bacterium]|nr:heavy-metal-associated domain-containing protein [Candidatus Falkowbacteria bacterium]